MKNLKRKLHWWLWGKVEKLSKKLYPYRHYMESRDDKPVKKDDDLSNHPPRSRTPPKQWDYKL